MTLIDTLSKEEREKCQKASFKKGKILFREDDECQYVGIVLKGVIQITSYSLSGQEIIYNELKENEMFGNNLIFSEQPFYKGHVIAKTDVELWLISKTNLVSILQSNIPFLNAYLKQQAEFSKRLNSTIKILSLSSAEERLMYYLKENNPLSYRSITSLAANLYLSRETLSRLISRLVKEGKILQKGKKLYLVK